MLSDEFWSKPEKDLLEEAIYFKRNFRLTVECLYDQVSSIECGLVDSYGLPVELVITNGEVDDCIREQITKRGTRPVIPRKCNSLKGNADKNYKDWGLYV